MNNCKLTSFWQDYSLSNDKKLTTQWQLSLLIGGKYVKLRCHHSIFNSTTEYSQRKVETEVKDRSEGYCEKTIFIKNEEVLSNVTEAIYGRLLFPNWKSMKGLDRYIKIIGARITQLVDAGRTEYFVANKTKSAIVNTGMMDLFGNDFLVLYRYYEKYKTYIAERVIESKQDYLNYGFTKEQ